PRQLLANAAVVQKTAIDTVVLWNRCSWRLRRLLRGGTAMKSKSFLLMAATAVGLANASPAMADTFSLNHCDIVGGCTSAPASYGTVNLQQVGFDVIVTVDVGINRFVETSTGGGVLFAFNSSSFAGLTVVGPHALFNGTDVSFVGGLTG